MKKLLVLIIFCFLFINGWNWPIHQMMMEKIYYSLDFEDQQKLDINLMKEGSIAPDKVFKDTVLHHYPPSYNKALYWIDIMNETYGKDWDNFSYAFGVMSHYVSDSFVAPHCVSKESYSMHAKFESPEYISKVKCFQYSYDLNLSLYNASIQGQKDWTDYVLTYNESIAKREIDESIKMLYGILLSYNFTCNEFETKVTKRGFYISKRVWIFLVVVVVGFGIYYIFSKTR